MTQFLMGPTHSVFFVVGNPKAWFQSGTKIGGCRSYGTKVRFCFSNIIQDYFWRKKTQQGKLHFIMIFSIILADKEQIESVQEQQKHNV